MFVNYLIINYIQKNLVSCFCRVAPTSRYDYVPVHNEIQLVVNDEQIRLRERNLIKQRPSTTSSINKANKNRAYCASLTLIQGLQKVMTFGVWTLLCSVNCSSFTDDWDLQLFVVWILMQQRPECILGRRNCVSIFSRVKRISSHKNESCYEALYTNSWKMPRPSSY